MENNLNIGRSVADSLFNQEAIVYVDNRNHNFKAGLDYFMDKKNTIGVLVNGSLSDPAIKNKSVTPISYNPPIRWTRLLVADNSSVMKRNNVKMLT
ncbi:MAG: hypothetical protein IPH68_13010 [Chitinophagaceae bacterium]|nr:hypothetical protein [Chitinophagaceae bacterium]